jgi:excisionase family DNA binding protein
MEPDQRTSSEMPAAADEFLTVAEIAGLLKLNQQTVRNWIDNGSLVAVRWDLGGCGFVGRRWTCS